MLVLGLDTSGLEGSIALLLNQDCLGERQLNQAGRRHAQSLVLEIGELLHEHGYISRNVDAIAVSRGPGSFTGLRVGMVCAKTFAYATGCRFIAVDTFAAIAENLPDDIAHVYVIEDAQREDLFVGEYRRNDSLQWSEVGQTQIEPVHEFLSRRTLSDVVIGPGIRKVDVSVSPARWLSETMFSQPKAATIAELGRRWLISGAQSSAMNDSDFWKASPFYLRMSAAEEKHAAVAISGPKK